MTNEPKKYEKLTQHLILFSKRWYGRTDNTIDDLATFMFKWSWTPKEFYTPNICYELVAHAFVECCSKYDIYQYLRGCFNPYVRYLNKSEPMTIVECIDSMLGLMSVLQVVAQDKGENDYDLVELPKPSPKYMIVTPELCKTCESLRTAEDKQTYCTLRGECIMQDKSTVFVPEVKE